MAIGDVTLGVLPISRVREIGDRVRVTALFTDTDGNLVSPSTVTATVQDPSGVETPTTLTEDSAGTYHLDFDLTDDGDWDVRVAGIGTLVAADELRINVPPSAFP